MHVNDNKFRRILNWKGRMDHGKEEAYIIYPIYQVLFLRGKKERKIWANKKNRIWQFGENLSVHYITTHISNCLKYSFGWKKPKTINEILQFLSQKNQRLSNFRLWYGLFCPCQINTATSRTATAIKYIDAFLTY